MIGQNSGLSDELRLLKLITEQDTWVRRRVDRTDLEEDGETTRRISFDLTLPGALHVELDGGALAPLMLLRKTPLRRLDTAGPDGRPLPVLGRTDNGQLVAQMLTAALRVLYPSGISSATEDAIHEAVFEDDPEAMDGRVGAVRATLPATPSDTADQVDVVLALMEDLVRHFLFVVLLPREAVDRRVVVKLSVGEEISTGPIDWAFSPAGRSLDCPLQLHAAAASCHFEFRAPPGLRVASVVLLDDLSNPVDHPGPAVDTGHTAHLTGLHAVPATGSGLRARIELEPVVEGFVRQTAWSATFVAVLLLVGALAVDRLEGAFELNRGGSVAAAALAVPALFLSLESRRPEHAAVARALLVPRLINVAAALVLYVTAVLLVTSPSGGELAPILWVAFALELVAVSVAWSLERTLSDP